MFPRFKVVAAAAALLASGSAVALTLPASATDVCTSVGDRAGAPAYSCPIWLPKDENRVPVYAQPGSGTEVGHLFEGGRANWFWCQVEGPESKDYGYSSRSWAKTMADNGKVGFVPANYLDAQANTWQGLPTCGGGQAPAPQPGGGSADYNNLSQEQIDNARTIIAVGKGTPLSERAQVIAIATALQESTLRNLDWGDRDSLGLFQQRPSTGWGTPQQVTDPVLASKAFYGFGDHTNNPGLAQIPGWESMPLTQAAQAVQRSGFPDAYAKWEPLAQEIVERNRDVAPIK